MAPVAKTIFLKYNGTCVLYQTSLIRLWNFSLQKVQPITNLPVEKSENTKKNLAKFIRISCKNKKVYTCGYIEAIQGDKLRDYLNKLPK